MLDFSAFEAYIIVGVVYWYISLPLGLLLAGVTIFAKSQGVWLRGLSSLGALFFLLPFVVYGLFSVKIELRQQKIRQEREAHSWVLKEPATVAGVDIPADSKIYYNTWFDMDLKRRATLDDIETFELSAPTNIFGIAVTGRFHKGDYEWEGMLHNNQMIEGWPCSGKIILNVSITDNGKKRHLQKCTLYKDHTVFGRRLPKGTEIELKSWRWTFNFPKGKIISFDPNSGELTFSSNNTNAFNFQ
ncbi:MAG TPA: hypothetical protein VK112_01850 [Fodinibius sp.]|nr:hypothetical protein [Fodinibius sp.]